jgi:cytochrome P450
MSNAPPAHIRAAPTHPDPYPYYARLAVEQPVSREGDDGPWVVAGAEAVRSVLTNCECLTRPAGHIVPDSMVGTPVGEIYGALVRLNDGPIHCAIKPNITGTLDGLDLEATSVAIRRQTEALAASIKPEQDPACLTKFIYALPVETISPLVGIPREAAADVARWIGEYGAASAAAATGVPALTAEIAAAGQRASRQLLDLFANLAEQTKRADATLLARMLAAAETTGRFSREAAGINALGLLIQGFAATSALIGNALLTLGRQSDVRAAVMADRKRVRDLLEEVLRCDPVAHSTPRFVARDGVVAGHPMRKDDFIIVVLAAASRDAALNPDPNRFDLNRKNRRYLAFGAGAHACAGPALATLIAEIAVNVVLDRGGAPERLTKAVTYHPSAHVRMPVFGG